MSVMALDNPSYFTIPGGSSISLGNRSNRFSLLRKHKRMGTGSSSASTSSIPLNKEKKNERYSSLPTSTTNVNTSVCAAVPESSPSLTTENGLRKSLRSLFGANAFDSTIQTQMFVLGMPRPSDIAPSVHQTSHSSKKHHSRNASTGKPFRTSGGGILSSRSPHAADPTQEFSVKEPTSNDDRYYNDVPGGNFLQSGRRHSIGAYFSKKSASASRSELIIQEETCFSDEIVKFDFKFVEKKRDDESHGKKCRCSQTSTGGKSGMEDIIIISSSRSQAADLWVTYLRTCFDQIRKNRNKPPFRVLGIEIESGENSKKPSSTLEEKLKNAKLIVFIICPVFLEYIDQYPDNACNICRYICPDGVLAMLLGIGEETLTDSQKTALLTYSQWTRMESVKDRDEKFVGDFLGAAMDIISRNITQHSPLNEKGSFVLMPKKVNKNQNKVLILLNEPISKEDNIRVTVIRNSESFEIPSVKKRNPYTLIFRMPEEFLAVSLLVTIRVERNGQDLGSKLLKCESQLYAMVQLLKSCDSPVEFMCQALNIVPCDKDKLDDVLMSSFQKNVPPNFNVLQTTGLGQLHRGVISKEEYPTLLHFAARFGLEKLCWVLLECPGGELACDIRNCNELTPSELAENAGHTKLANALCGYMQMTEFTNVYTFLKGMTHDKTNAGKSDTSDDYLNPRPVSETYQVPPSPRPLAQVYSHPPFGYMQMQSPKSVQSASIFDSHGTAGNLGSSKERLAFRKNSDENLKRMESEHHPYRSPRDNSGNGIQDELIEIINDFKNNVFTISEVEKLVDDWRNRNDVQQSFREKQEQLNKMREEYERVQQKLRDEMKQVGRLSPMERIRNFFRSKSKDTKSGEGPEREKKLQGENLLPHRPSSGLSLQSSSSSSSGRLSTGSHCSGTSLGDSGTHSDAESEKKGRSSSGSCCNTLKTKGSLDNYDVPPNPVCIITNKAKSSNGIMNYDIPPSSLSSENGAFKHPWDNEFCPSCDSLSNQANYYNLLAKDIPIPNQSTLHDRLVKTSSRTCLKAVEESAEIKTEESNCYEYINLPKINGTAAEGSLIHDQHDNEAIPDSGVQLPDYVNVEGDDK